MPSAFLLRSSSSQRRLCFQSSADSGACFNVFARYFKVWFILIGLGLKLIRKPGYCTVTR